MAVGLALLGIALGLRAVEGKTFLYADLQHFFQFAEVAFTRDHAEYYASVADQRYTYAHLPLFPLMLAPVVRVYRALGWEPILAVKTLVHVFDVGTAILLIRLARRNGLPRAAALGVGALWLYAPWVYEAGALNGHVASVAAFFLVAGLLRAGVAWQAGILLALAFTTRSELLVAALAMGGVYARRGRGALGAYALGAGGVFAVVVGPYLVRDAAALHWGVVGHLAGRGDGLPVLRSFIQTATGAFPDALAGPQDWAMPVALGIAILVGLVERDPSGAVFRASLVYALALTLGHGRYFVFPLVAGLAFGARPWVIVGLA
ncbi:MAG: hypothetical protein FJ029_14500, partial [Actinobacteria bacterium]|nr:hypothetical protein [Actinomycetota bacterium]